MAFIFWRSRSESAANMQRINDQRERRTRRLTIRSKHGQIEKVDRHPSKQ
jgi:hypothetical protein